jgi:hypothetical protein
VENFIIGALTYDKIASHFAESPRGKSISHIPKEEQDKQTDEFSCDLGNEVPDILGLSPFDVTEHDQSKLDEDLLRLNLENRPLFLSKPEKCLPSFEGDD